ncbi:hypothetical protein AOLI_G00217080 [Acnodon oligacanthus]
MNDCGRWYDEDCSLKHNFVCQHCEVYYDQAILRRNTKIQTVKVKLSFNGKKDLSDPEAKATILKQIQKLKEKWILAVTKVIWKEKDGNVFCPEKKTTN